MELRPTSNTRRFLRRRQVLITGLALATLMTGIGATTAGASSSLVVSTLTTKTYGTILTTSRTVYTLAPSKVACAAKCLTYWPEVLLPKGTQHPKAGHGVSAAKLGTIARPGGRLQVTYAGKALYWYSSDKSATDVKGDVTDTWGKWSAVVLVKPSGASSTTTTTSGGGGGGIGF